MSDDGNKDGGGKRWLWAAILGVLAVIGVLVMIGFASVLIKWGIVALMVYAAFVLARRLLKTSPSETSDTLFLPEADGRDDPLARLEQSRELEKLKARMDAKTD